MRQVQEVSQYMNRTPECVEREYGLCDVVYEECTCCAAVVAPGDGSEALLACGIPELELDALVSDLDEAARELDADGVRGLVLDCGRIKAAW